MKRVLLGNAHPEIAIGLNNVACALYEQRKYDAGGNLSTRARCEMQRKLLGADHPDVAMTLNNLAFVTHDKGDLKTAIELSKASLETYRRALGAEHPSVARGMSNLGDVDDRSRRSRRRPNLCCARRSNCAEKLWVQNTPTWPAP